MTETQSMKQILKNPFFLLFSVLLFFTPLVLAKGINELFEFPKTLFVYLLGGFIIAFFLTDIVFRPKKLMTPAIPVLLFVLVNIISTIFSSHKYTSLFGYYSRFNDGLISTLVFFSLYFVAKNKLSKNAFRGLLKIVLFTIVPISILGLIQHFKGVERVYSTFGQPNWLAQYLCIILPLCIFMSLKQNFRLWFPVYLLGFSCLWFTYSVSGVLGFVISLVFLIFILKKRQMLEKGAVSKFLVLISFSLIIASFNLGIFKEKIQDMLLDIKKGTAAVSKVYALSDDHKVSDPGFIRLELWKSTLALIVDSPKGFLIGTGPETFPYEFQTFRNLKLNYSSEWDYVFNKPHNYFLEVWSELGILGLVSFIALLVWLLRKYPYFLTASIVGFLVTSFFGWPVVATSLLFWFFLSYAERFDIK